MSKYIFILFLFFCTTHSFSQNGLLNTRINKSTVTNNLIGCEKAKIETVTMRSLKETEVELLLKENLCEILSIKISDLLDESMYKKINANV